MFITIISLSFRFFGTEYRYSYSMSMTKTMSMSISVDKQGVPKQMEHYKYIVIVPTS
mgnify:CR=1 FL=1